VGLKKKDFSLEWLVLIRRFLCWSWLRTKEFLNCIWRTERPVFWQVKMIKMFLFWPPSLCLYFSGSFLKISKSFKVKLGQFEGQKPLKIHNSKLSMKWKRLPTKLTMRLATFLSMALICRELLTDKPRIFHWRSSLLSPVL
jgi:hypothetical protein